MPKASDLLEQNLRLIAAHQAEVAERLRSRTDKEPHGFGGAMSPVDVSLPRLVHPVVTFILGLGQGETLQEFFRQGFEVSQYVCVFERDRDHLIHVLRSIDLKPIYDRYGERFSLCLEDNEATLKLFLFEYFIFFVVQLPFSPQFPVLHFK